MRIFSLYDTEGQFYLREKNPLDSQRYLVSETAYKLHEREYMAAALLFVNPVLGKKEYTENEIREQWQFNAGIAGAFVWEDISEPNFVGTQPEQYRRVFKYVGIEVTRSYQDNVKAWLIERLGEDKATNIPERSLRFLEEALELVQACGLDQIRAQKLVTYVFNRPVGNRAQEIGGVAFTLAGLCAANGLDMREEAELELVRNYAKSDEELQEKQNYKTGEGITAIN